MDTNQTSALNLCENPAEYFSYSINEMFSLEREEIERVQLSVLKHRFDHLRESIPMLKALVESIGTDKIENFDDVVPLLFDHTVYKSYPPSLLAKNRFDAITRWLGKLTTQDLSKVDVSDCECIDDWIDTLDRETPLMVSHSSGTSGTVSFLPILAEDFRRSASCWPVMFLQKFGEPQSYHGECPNLNIVAFEYRSSRRSSGRYSDFLCEFIAGGEERYHALHPTKMSADMMYLAGKIRLAQAKGQSLESLEISPKLMERRAEFAEIEASAGDKIEPFFEQIKDKLAGQPTFIMSFLNVLVGLVDSAKAKGQENIFSEESVVFTSGGNKGAEIADDWEQQVKTVTGAHHIAQAYGMSEIMGLNPRCDHGHYHMVPWVIPFVLDPDTRQPLPRAGTVTGRAAFFDLGCKSHWGGFVSGDEITVHWDDQCPCGMKGVFLEESIIRYSEKQGGDDKINCAATGQAHEDAIKFLMAQ